MHARKDPVHTTPSRAPHPRRTSSPPKPTASSAHHILQLQKYFGNRATAHLLTAQRKADTVQNHNIQLPSLTPDAPLPAPAPIQRFMDNIDCVDEGLRTLHQKDATALANAAAAVNGTTYEQKMPSGKTSLYMNNLTTVKSQLKTVLEAQGFTSKEANDVLKIAKPSLGVGTHKVNFFKTDGTPIFSFTVRILPTNGSLATANQADTDLEDRIRNHITFADIVSGDFVHKHALYANDPEKVLETSLNRGQSSSGVFFDATAQTNLLTEVRNRMLNDEYTSSKNFTTNDEYTIYDIDPGTHDLIRYTTRFRYSVYHADNGIWKVMHFEGVSAPSAQTVVRNVGWEIQNYPLPFK